MTRAEPELDWTSQQPYIPAPFRLNNPSSAPLPDPSIATVASHETASSAFWNCSCNCCPGWRGIVEVEEWWAEPQPSAMHEPPYAIYYPPTKPDTRRFFGCRPGNPVINVYPPEFEAAAERHYPTREQYSSVVDSYNAALEKAFCATSPDPMWFNLLVALTFVTSPYFIWREWKTQRSALRTMRQEIVWTLRDANEQLDAEWRLRQVKTGEGQHNNRRWQWRWIGLYINLKSHTERPQLALVHIGV